LLSKKLFLIKENCFVFDKFRKPITTTFYSRYTEKKTLISTLYIVFSANI